MAQTSGAGKPPDKQSSTSRLEELAASIPSPAVRRSIGKLFLPSATPAKAGQPQRHADKPVAGKAERAPEGSAAVGTWADTVKRNGSGGAATARGGSTQSKSGPPSSGTGPLGVSVTSSAPSREWPSYSAMAAAERTQRSSAEALNAPAESGSALGPPSRVPPAASSQAAHSSRQAPGATTAGSGEGPSVFSRLFNQASSSARAKQQRAGGLDGGGLARGGAHDSGATRTHSKGLAGHLRPTTAENRAARPPRATMPANARRPMTAGGKVIAGTGADHARSGDGAITDRRQHREPLRANWM